MSARCLWWMQSNLGSALDLIHAVVDAGQPFAAIPRIPFSDHVPAFEWQGPVVFYGSTIMTSMLAAAQSGWSMQPLVWFDPEKFRMSRCFEKYGRECLNFGADVTTLGGLLATGHGPDAKVFIRPDEDSKAFSGEVIRYGDLRDWANKITGTPLSLDLPIIAAEPLPIEMEWRVWMIRTQPIAASAYRLHGRLHPIRGAAPDVLEYARDLARTWMPAPVYCLDIGRHDRRLRLVELTCFNSAGFYAADIESIVRQVSAFVEGA